jgi:hypothetical protein
MMWFWPYVYVFSSSVMCFKWYHVAIGNQTIIKWIEMFRDRGSSVSTVDMHQAESRNWMGSGRGRDFSVWPSGCLEVKHLGCVVVNWFVFIIEGQEWVVHVEHEPCNVVSVTAHTNLYSGSKATAHLKDIAHVSANLPQYVFMAWCLIKHMGSFTSYFSWEFFLSINDVRGQV